MLYFLTTILLLQFYYAHRAFKAGSSLPWVLCIALTPVIGLGIFVCYQNLSDDLKTLHGIEKIDDLNQLDFMRFKNMFYDWKRLHLFQSLVLKSKVKVLRDPNMSNKHELANQLLSDGDYLKSYKLYDELSNSYVCEPDALYFKAVAAWNLAQYDECKDALDLIKRQFPSQFKPECEIIRLICEEESLMMIQNKSKDNSRNLEMSVDLDDLDTTIEVRTYKDSIH